MPNSEDDHEPYLERFNGTLKECCRMIFVAVPLDSLPRIIIVELVYLQIFVKFDTLGHITIVLGRTYTYNTLCHEGLNLESMFKFTHK